MRAAALGAGRSAPSPGRDLLLPVLGLAFLAAAGCARDDRPARPDAGAAARPRAEAPAAAAPALCAHGVPADQCTRCDPALAAAFQELGDWCQEHGLPKSHCRQCDPGLTFTAKPLPADWCREHAVPESMCTRCNPALLPKFIEAGDYCREHRLPLSVCPVHHPELVEAAGAPPPSFLAAGTVVRLASPRTAEDVGIRTVKAERRRFVRTLEVVGHLDFDQNRLAQLSARGEALVLEVKVDVGDEVKAGQPLATLASAAVGSGQAQLLSAEARLKAARSALQREEALVHKGVTPKKALEATEAEVAAAEAELSATRAGLAAAGAGSGGTGGRYVLTAPFAGTVVARDAVAGRSAAPGQVLLQVADLSSMWARLDVPEAEAHLVRPGQKVSLSLDAARGAPQQAVVARVGASVDPATRTVPARVELPNPERALKAGSFVRARLQVGGDRDAVLVPAQAVQRAEGRPLVFVKKGPGLYEPVPVTLGDASDGLVELVAGLDAGAEVVTTGAFLLKTEVLKDSIGAGCCEEGE